MRCKTFVSVSALALLSWSASIAQPPQSPPLQNAPQPFVSPIFGDHMVLQRGKPNPIWGWSEPGDTVRVQVGEHTATATAGADGKWTAKIDPPAPGGPYTIQISGKRTVELQEVLVGDVWICAGQSNMQFGLGQARNGAEEVKNANYPQIRFYNVGERDSYSPADVPRGGPWRVITPAGLGGRGGGLSAAAYFFDRKVFQSVHVPIGLMQVAVGGVPARPSPALTPCAH